jgi:hypothetical protein
MHNGMRAWQRLAGPLPVACQRHAVKSRPALVPVHGMYYYFFFEGSAWHVLLFFFEGSIRAGCRRNRYASTLR